MFPDRPVPQPTQPTLAQQVPTLAAPVLLYSGSSAAIKAQAQQAQQNTSTQKNVQQANQQTPPGSLHPSDLQATGKNEGVQTEQKKSGATQKVQEQEKAEKIEAPTTIVEKTESPSIFKASEKTFTPEAGSSNDPGEIRKRRLTLADLFKSMPHLMKRIAEGSEEGEQLVITQGDMRYYSFLKKFLGHINQVFAFHGGPQKLVDWYKAGRIKANAGFSVVIDQKGNVLETVLRHSTGDPAADKLLLETFDAASPFPPVPESFGHQQVRVELVSVV